MVKWKRVYTRFREWRDESVLEWIFRILSADIDMENERGEQHQKGKVEKMDFYSQTSENASKLSPTERNILNYVVKNMHLVKDMSIRDLAKETYVSTTTLFRFVKKLGYEGFGEFIDAVSETEKESRKIHIPSIVHDDNYRDSYLKNVVEAVKVITDEKIDAFYKIMGRYPHIYILAEGLSSEVARYFSRLLIIMGYSVEVPTEEYEFKALLRRVKRDDVLLILSYTGDNKSIINKVERIFAIATPTIISFTRADNNIIQNMSDLNFYVFADEIDYEGIDVTSRCGMIAILETLMYKRITKDSNGSNKT